MGNTYYTYSQVFRDRFGSILRTDDIKSLLSLSSLLAQSQNKRATTGNKRNGRHTNGKKEKGRKRREDEKMKANDFASS